MKLASVDEIRSELGFDDMEDINAVISESLHAATIQLESILSTTFAAGSATDAFFVPEPGYSTAFGGVNITEFRLTKGFLTAFNGGVIFDTYAQVVAATPQSSITVSDGLKVDFERGVVTDPSTAYHNQFVTFSYTHGFDVDPADPDCYDLTQVPFWLRMAAKARAKYLVKDSPPVKEANIELDPKILDQEFRNLVGIHLRYTPMAIVAI